MLKLKTNPALISCFSLFFSISSCSSQDLKETQTTETKKKENEMKLEDRRPAVAGSFYPSEAATLKADLKKMFGRARPAESENVPAIITPHAGYVYSGEVAASSFNQIDHEKEYDNIFIIGSTHSYPFYGASVYSKGNYITPLGTVKVNREIAEKLIDENAIFSFQRDIHRQEHSIEVQLPFLQYIMNKDFRIVPVVVGTQNREDCKKIAEALRPYFTGKNLFVISTDFSHYPSYKDAVEVDKASADAILTNSPDKLYETLQANAAKNIRGLSTSMCGWTSVMTLLYLTENRKDIIYKQIQYRNSGDVSMDSSRVVGYWAICASGDTKTDEEDTETEQEFTVSDGDKIALLKLARKTIEDYINKGKVEELKEADFSETLGLHCGAFVTLHKDGQLRGCIGRFMADEPLYKVVQDMAVSASTRDYRFSTVTSSEIADLEVEVSVLSPLKQIDSIDQFEMGKHGIYIKKGYKSGTFLPQVANETRWTKEEFLGHCSRDKAGLGWDGWKDADLFIYTANVFSEKDFPEISKE
ncbi:MAG: AmmeMemoRadiSam system protein B [Bacteroidetes bacterium]|nr:AmmeMemoRadiSam system protein B [Bacteroidota bacterium]